MGTGYERLFEAFTHLARIGPEDIPDGDLRTAFAERMAALTSERPRVSARGEALLECGRDPHQLVLATA